MSENQNNGPDLGGDTNNQQTQQQAYTNQQPNQQQPNQQQPNYQQPNYQQANYQQPNQQQPNYQQPNYQQPPFQQPYQAPYGYQQKSKMAAALLGIFLGGLGIHSFYLGYTGKGVAQIIVTIITCGIGSIWGLIEGIIILTNNNPVDANGVPLSN